MYVVHKKDSEISSVWHYYYISSDGKTAKCKECNKILKCEGGSTKGLHTHLHTIHKTKILSEKSAENEKGRFVYYYCLFRKVTDRQPTGH